ncbi:MAG: thioether cross-link-forming SCIFF peptide maturase [Clostridia bacterium]|nr:thioether cross-link-forming SCIFF peptide maturase [Clostridia bacterium]
MVHKFDTLGVKCALDVCSGTVHILDDISYRMLDFFDEEGNFDQMGAKEAGLDDEKSMEAVEELIALKEKNQLFTKDIYRALVSHKEKKSVIKALCLHIAHDCNLRCRYCFAHGGEYMGKREIMSPEVGKKAIDFVIKESGARRNIEIDYFGGEPLMNFETVKEITEYAKAEGEKHGKNFRFTITTNGILLDDKKMEYINENMGNIVLSIDGRKEVHDKVRVRVDGSGSYDSIVNKFIKVARSRNQENYYVRGTFTRDNLDFAEDVMHLADLGFEQISVEPVVAQESEDYALRKEDLPRIFEEYDRLAEKILEARKNGKWFNFFHYMIDLHESPCAYKMLSGCGAGHEYAAVTPSGDIYPCHQFVNDPKYKMGDVFEGVVDKDIRDVFVKSNIYTKEPCGDCWARFYCSGGCAANAISMNKDINKPYLLACEMEKKRVECAIAIKAREALDEE